MSVYSRVLKSSIFLHHGIPMTPDEIVLKLNHYAELEQQLVELENDRNAWRESAEQLGRQIASLTHKIPTDIPLQESSNE